MPIQLFFFILALVFFLLDGFKVASERVSWTPLGFAALVVALFLLG